MTPGLSVPGVNFSQAEPQKNAFSLVFSDFGSDLQETACFLEVAVKIKELQFTFSELVVPVGALQDTGK